MTKPDERETLRAWLRQALADQNLTPTALARRAGVAQTTLTRFLNSDDAPILSTRSLAKIRDALARGTDAQPGPATTPGATGFGEPDAVPYVMETGDPLTAAIKALIGDRRAADPWIIKSRALELAGLLPGDIAIVDLNEAARPDDVVCAQDYRASGTETVFRIYAPPFLVAASLDKDVRKPLFVDNDRVLIKGTVIATLRWRG